jgi:APA family basic amino acid/polyamine antiporter
VTQPASKLLKVLGLAFGVAILVGNTIGSGILRTPGDVAAALPSVGWFLGVWAAGGIYASLGAMSLAELAVMTPKSGGQYVYARRALGEYPGFVIGWTDWISSCAATATAAIALGELAAQVATGLTGRENWIALAVLAVFTAVHWMGVRSSDLTQQLLSVLKVLALVVVAVACMLAPAASGQTAAPAVPEGFAFLAALVFVFQNVLYTYDGWNGVTYFGGEMKDPGREIPRAMLLGVLVVLGVYLALNVAFLHVLGIGGLAGEKFAAAASAKVAFGSAGEGVVRAVIAVTMLGLVNAVLLISSRVPFAMAEDRLLPRWVSRVNHRGTPNISLGASAALTGGLIASGTFQTVLALAAFFFVLQYATSFAWLFVLRAREPDAPRGYRVWGYPVVPAIVLLGAIAFLVASFVSDRTNSLICVGLVVASYPLYVGAKRWSRGDGGGVPG